MNARAERTPVNRTLSAFTRGALLTLASADISSSESVTPADVVAGKLIPASTSPDGKLCLLEVFHDGTTVNSVIVGTTDRKENLGSVPIHTEWGTDRPYKGRTTVVWSPDSTRVAVHDPIPKHSDVFIYRRVGERFERLETPDILAVACKHWGISRERVVSSGQRPLRWSPGDIVTIEVSARLKDGKQLWRSFPIHAPREGKSNTPGLSSDVENPLFERTYGWGSVRLSAGNSKTMRIGDKTLLVYRTDAFAELRHEDGKRLSLATGRLEFDPATGDINASDWPVLYAVNGH